jgi:hypothetical protein
MTADCCVRFALILSDSLITGKLSPLDSFKSSTRESHRAVVNDFSPGPVVYPSVADAANNWYVRNSSFRPFRPAVLA